MLNWLPRAGSESLSFEPPKVGDTSLHCAITNKDSLHTNMLIQRGAEPNIPNKKGNTALHAAIKVQDAKIILSVLEAGADVTAPNAIGDTPLHIASQKVRCHVPCSRRA